ncbi:hypothetical protein [Alloscardovia omnicolens]|uniref:hypothetical protein n=1 Tax=Alloscardovia omnicolens TaxID=419015 RepID=UPI003C6F962C
MDLLLRRKDVEYSFPSIIKVGYCQLKYTLQALDMERVGYIRGVNGWNCDVYRLEKGIALTTGYRPFGNVRVDSDRLRALEEAVQAVPWEYYDKRAQVARKGIESIIEDITSGAFKPTR